MSTDRLMNKEVVVCVYIYVYTHIYTQWNISAIKRNTFESVLKSWMNLECSIQSEINQKEKDKYCIWNLGRWY